MSLMNQYIEQPPHLFEREQMTVKLAKPVPYRELLPQQKKHIKDVLLMAMPVGTDPAAVARVLHEENPKMQIYLRLPQFADTESLLYILTYLL